MTTEGPTDQPVGELPAVGQTTPAQRLPNADAGHGTTLTVKQAAARLGIHEQTLRRWLWAGKVPAAHLAPSGKGEVWQIPVASLEALRDQAKPAVVAAQVEVGEAEQLRRENADLKAQLELQRALADERRHQLDQLHQTMRALNAGVRPPDSDAAADYADPLALAQVLQQQVADLKARQLEAEQVRKRWWRRS